MSAVPPSENEYVLGVSRDEYDRLGLQHSLWKTRARRLWKRAGLPKKTTHPLKMLDCGCGPGFTTFELAEYLGPKGRVVGLDMAEKYLRALETRAAAEKADGSSSKLAKIETKQVAIDTFSIPETDFDAAYARWIFIFLKDPEAAIRNIGRHLRPGALFMLQEYVDYRTMALHSPALHSGGGTGPAVFRKMVEAVIRSWAVHGGDANVGGRLPALLAKNGFEIVSLKPQTRVGRPHQKIWQWPDSFYRNYLPILVRDGHLSEAEAAESWKIWEAASRDPNSFYVGPMVLDIVARKKKLL